MELFLDMIPHQFFFYRPVVSYSMPLG